MQSLDRYRATRKLTKLNYPKAGGALSAVYNPEVEGAYANNSTARGQEEQSFKCYHFTISGERRTLTTRSPEGKRSGIPSTALNHPVVRGAR